MFSESEMGKAAQNGWEGVGLNLYQALEKTGLCCELHGAPYYTGGLDKENLNFCSSHIWVFLSLTLLFSKMGQGVIMMLSILFRSQRNKPGTSDLEDV